MDKEEQGLRGPLSSICINRIAHLYRMGKGLLDSMIIDHRND